LRADRRCTATRWATDPPGCGFDEHITRLLRSGRDAQIMRAEQDQDHRRGLDMRGGIPPGP